MDEVVRPFDQANARTRSLVHDDRPVFLAETEHYESRHKGKRMSFLIQDITRRTGFSTLICLFAAVSGSGMPIFSLAQDVEPGVASEIQDEVVEEAEAVMAVQVVGLPGMEARRMMAAKRFQLTQIFLVEVEEIQNICKLDKKQITKLRIGAKGAVKKLTAEWNKQTSQQRGLVQQGGQVDDESDTAEEEEIQINDADEIDQNTLQMIMMNGMGNPFKFDDPLDHRFWQSTLRNVLTDAQLEKFREYRQDRKAAKRNALIDSAMGSLTIELGLTGEQRIKLAEIIRPPMEKAEISCFTFYEPFVLYYYASQADSKKLKEVLSPAQLQKWKIFIAPSKEIGQMMGMEDEGVAVRGGVAIEESNLLLLIDRALETIARSVKALLNIYAK